MSASHAAPDEASHPDTQWQILFRAGAMASLIMVALIPIQLFIFAVWPPPVTVSEWFTLFRNNWLLGLLSLDLLYIVNNVLLVLIYLALYIALKKAAEAGMLIALVLGLVGVAAYFASNTSFEMLSLSSQYAAAATEAQRSVLLAAGQAMLAVYKGTAFNVYYVLNGIALVIIAGVMLRSTVFSRATAYAGLLGGVLMVIPSTAGTLGVIFSIASLVPWTVFTVLVALKLSQLGHPAAEAFRV